MRWREKSVSSRAFSLQIPPGGGQVAVMQVDVGSGLSGWAPLFAAAAETATKAGDSGFTAPDLSLFDFLLIGFFGLGFWRGKVRGISEELLDFLQWLVIFLSAGFLYGYVGDLLKRGGLGQLEANIGGYMILVIAISLIFNGIKSSVGNKLLDSDFFGGWEYRLGGLAGGIRFICTWLCVVALLNARYFDADFVKAQRKAQQKEVGIVVFPTWGMLQHMALYESLSGPYIRQYLKYQLMTPVGYAPPEKKSEPIGKREQKVLDDVSSPAKPAPAPPEKKE